MKNIDGRLALITGASSGIGAETAKQFALRGATVLLLSKDAARLEKVKRKIISEGGRAEMFPVDLSDFRAVAETAEKIKNEFGIPDIIFNNAGLGKWKFIEETDCQEAIDDIFVPYLGAFFITRAFLPEMLKRNSGHIVNITSFAAITPFPGACAYIASRKAMLGFHEALTADLYETKIKTSLVYFAKVNSTFWNNNPGSEERLPKIQDFIPVISAEKAGEIIAQGIMKEKKVIFAPFILGVLEFMSRLNPSATRFLLNKTGYKRQIK